MVRHLLNSRRRGIAPLELVMALPLLLACLVVMFVLGDAMIKLNGTVVAARADAWSERHRPAAPGIFLFVPSSTRQSMVRGRAEHELATTQVLGALPAATSEHTVMAGSWDHRDIDLNNPLSWQAYAKVGSSGLIGSAQALPSLTSGTLRSALSELGRSLATDLMRLKNEQAGARAEAQQASRDNRSKAAEDVQKERSDTARLRDQTIPGLRAEIAALDGQIANAIRDKESQPTIPGHTVHSSAQRLETLQYEQAMRPSALSLPSSQQERNEHAQRLGEIDGELPSKIQQKADKRVRLTAAEEELLQRERALAESERQFQALDTWDDRW